MFNKPVALWTVAILALALSIISLVSPRLQGLKSDARMLDPSQASTRSYIGNLTNPVIHNSPNEQTCRDLQQQLERAEAARDYYRDDPEGDWDLYIATLDEIAAIQALLVANDCDGVFGPIDSGDSLYCQSLSNSINDLLWQYAYYEQAALHLDAGTSNWSYYDDRRSYIGDLIDQTYEIYQGEGCGVGGSNSGVFASRTYYGSGGETCVTSDPTVRSYHECMEAQLGPAEDSQEEEDPAEKM